MEKLKEFLIENLENLKLKLKLDLPPTFEGKRSLKPLISMYHFTLTLN